MAMGQGQPPDNHPPSPNPISKPRPKPAPIPNGDFIGRSIRARCSPKPAPIPVGVVDALAARDADRSRNDEDSHDLGTGVRRQAPPAREYTYPDFMKCKPLYFKGTEGVVELTRWFERMETVFRISNCSVENQIKFSTCTLLGSALTWWNSHVKTVGHDVAYAMTWTNLKKKMTNKYCPRGEEDEEDPIDYPADGGDDDDDDDESSDDDEDDDDDVEEDEDDEEEEEHPALADSVPPPVHRVTTRMSIRDEPPIPFWSEAEIARLLAIPSPPSSPLSPWLSTLPYIPSPPLPVPSLVPVSPPPLPASPTYPLGFRAAMNQQRAESLSTSHSLPLPPPIILSYTRAYVAMMRVVAPSTYILASRSKTPPSGTPPLLPIPLPTPSPPLLLPSTDRRADRPELCLPPRKRLCIALGLRYEVDESSSAPTARPTGGFRADYGFFATLDDEIRRDPERDVGYGITDTWDEMLVDMPGAPATDDSELGQWMTNFVTTVRQDTDEIYGRLDDVQDDRSLMSSRLNMLVKERPCSCSHCLPHGKEARLSRKPGEHRMDASDTARSKVRALRTTILAQQMKIAALRAADCARQAQLVETLRLMSILQTQARTIKGVTDALAARDADRNTNGDDSHNSGTGVATNVVNSSLELALMCVRMFPEELDKIERYGGGLPDMIQQNGSRQFRPKQVQEAIEIATELMDKKIRSCEKKPYEGSKPLCPKCNYHHDGPCAPKCHKCYRVGHLALDYSCPANTNASNNQRGTREGQKPTCYECGAHGHFKRDCPKLKNNNLNEF
ncbi:putative reverse transcriptase domain-containing protein [Tanacetum coccineum]